MIKKLLRSPVASVVLFVLAAFLIGFGAIRAIQAAPAIQSQLFGAQVQLSEIRTALVENGELVYGEDDLLRHLYLNGKEVSKDDFKIGVTYDEVLSVRNCYFDEDTSKRVGTTEGPKGDALIPQFVRVTVSTYWTKDGERLRATDLDPSLIKINYRTDNGWSIDEAATTAERTVLYYADPLEVGEESKPFADKVTVSGDVIKAVSKAADGSDVYRYEGYEFHIQAKVDAVQTHNADDARVGAWGQIGAN